MSVIRFCIATWELKGFTPGGIGVMVHNLLTVYGSDPNCEISLAWYGGKELNERLFNHAFPRCKFISVNEWADRCKDMASFDAHQRFFIHPRHHQSHRLMLALKAFERENGSFDVIEFPDFAGVAFASLQEKKLGRAFAKSELVVRIHSTDSILRQNDHRPADQLNMFMMDFERKALADADLVVGHLAPVVQSVGEFFGLSNDWQDRSIVETPPVLIDSMISEARASFDPNTTILFTSKVQWFKQPHVFINAVVAFMKQTTDFNGEALLLAHVIDEELRAHCQALIPKYLQSRIKIISSLPNEVREKIIRRSLVINPSAYESFCLAAYEASYLGALIVLNENNPGFGRETPWVSGVNCWKYDGTTRGLLSTLKSMWENRASLHQEVVNLSHPAVPYWMRLTSNHQEVTKNGLPETVSVVIAVGAEFGDPMETIRSVLVSEGVNFKFLITCDRKELPTEQSAMLDRLDQSSLVTSGTVRIFDLGFCGGAAALFNLGIQNSETDLVLLSRAGAAFDPRFIVDAIAALAKNPNYDIVVPQISYADVSRDTSKRFIETLRLGESLCSGLTKNSFAHFELLCRRTIFSKLDFDEALDRFVDWDFHLRACALGIRYIVSNDVEVELDLLNSAVSCNFRSHVDSFLVKHAARFDGGRVSLVGVFDACQIIVQEAQQAEISIAKRPLSYYKNEQRPWWKLAFKNPTKPTRWLLVKSFQTGRRQ